MPAPRRKPRKTTIVLPSVPVQQRQRESQPLFRRESFPDGSVRAVRAVGREASEREQAMADFFGVAPELSLRANVRTMDGILAELVSRLNFREADFTPEVLNAAWQKAVDPFMASRASLVSIDRHVAVIRTSHPAIRYELQRLKPRIINALNSALGEGCVSSVRIAHG